MKRTVFFAAFLPAAALLASYSGPLRAEGPSPGQAPPAPSLSVRDAVSLVTALGNLDGHMIVTKQNGQEQAIIVPWEFESGSLRLRIATDLTALKPVVAGADQTRQGIIKELLQKTHGTEIRPGTVEYSEFEREYGQALDMPTGVALQRIKASELKLDKNEIPVTVLSALAPILDVDK